MTYTHITFYSPNTPFDRIYIRVDSGDDEVIHNFISEFCMDNAMVFVSRTTVVSD